MKYLIFIFLTGAALAEDLRPAGELFEMEPKWKVRVGDDLAWSARDLNDSTWAAEDSIKTYDGMVWYRQTVVVPTVAGRLAFRVPYVLRAAEFYANGEKVGEHGDIWHWWRQRRDLVEPMLLPASLRPGDRLTLAIRVDKADSGLGVAGIPTLGPVRAVRANYDQQFLRVLRSVLFTVWMGFLPLLTALATLLYWRGRRDRQEALWFGALNLGFFCLDFGAYMSLGATHLWMLLASWGVAFGRWGAWRFFDGSQVIAWRRQLPYLAILSAFALAAALGRSGWIPFRYTLGTSIAVSLLLLIRNAVDAWRRARRGEAWVAWFFAAFLIARAGEVLLLTESFVQWFTELGNPWTLLESPVRVELRSVGELLTGAVMAFLGIRRVLGLARERQALAAEFEAARTVQDLLLTQVPDTRVTGTPGFAVERAYLPAQQVGGDFYFLAPQSDGG